MKNKICGGIFCQKYKKEYQCSLCKKYFCKVCITEENKKKYCIDCFAGLFLIDCLGIAKYIGVKKNENTKKISIWKKNSYENTTKV